jgi:O-antigen ligase
VVAWLTGRWLRWASIVGAAVVALVVVTTPYGGRVTERLAASGVSFGDDVQVTTANFAARERLAHWRAGLAMARTHPVLGVGAGNFSHHYRDVTPVWRFRIPRGHAHNAYVHAAAQTGLVGLATYVGLLGAVGWRLSRALRATGGTARSLVVGAIGVTVAFGVHCMVDYLHVLSLGVQLSVVWALAEVAATSKPSKLEPGVRAG